MMTVASWQGMTDNGEGMAGPEVWRNGAKICCIQKYVFVPSVSVKTASFPLKAFSFQ